MVTILPKDVQMMRRSFPVLPLALALLSLLASATLWAKAAKAKKKPAKVFHYSVHGQPDAEAAPTAPVIAPPEAPTATELADDPTCGHAVVFRNDTGTNVDLAVYGGRQQRLLQGQSRKICAVGAALDFRVYGPQGGWQYGNDLNLNGIRLWQEFLVAPGGSVRVVNRTRERQQLLLDGREVALLQPDKEATIGPMTPEKHKIVAKAHPSQRAVNFEITAQIGETSQIDLWPPATSTPVFNPMAESARVHVDGRGYGTVESRQTVNILGLPPGVHQLRLGGEVSGTAQLQRLVTQKPGDGPPPSPEIALTLDNQTGEILKIPAALGRFGATLEKGQKVLWPIPRATFGLTLLGSESGLKYHLNFQAKTDPAQREWLLKRPEARLTLDNQTGETVQVVIPSHKPFELAAFASQDVQVQAGRLRVRADATQRQKSWNAGMRLTANAHVAWHIRAPATAVALKNNFREPVLVWLDNVPRRAVQAGKEQRFKVVAGLHEVRVTSKITLLSSAFRVRVADGDNARVAVQPPDGTLHLDDHVDERGMRVLVRGVQAAEVQAGAQAQVPVRAGKMTVEIRENGTDHSTIWQGSVAPTQQIDLPRPARDSVKLRVHWQGHKSAQMGLDDLAAVQVASGAILELNQVAPGGHLLSIEIAGHKYRREIKVDGRVPVRDVVVRQPVGN